MGESFLKFPQELYGNSVTAKEWLDCVGKQAKAHRPTILSIDSGIMGNALTRKSMRQSGCSFALLTPTWADQGIETFSWRIIKAWPSILTMANEAHAAGRQCRIDIPIKGEPRIINF